MIVLSAHADEPADLGPTDSLPPPALAPPAAADADVTAREIASSLRCPNCQGMSVADSPSKTSVEMKGRIRELVGQGYSETQIVDYFVDRYGAWVLLKPTYGDHWAVWLVPGLGLGLGLAWTASTILAWRREPEPVVDAPKDPYEERLLKELDS